MYVLKNLSINIKFVFAAFIVLFSSPLVSWGQESDVSDKAAEKFFYRCAGCHTVGGGNLKGPDLLNSTKWGDADLGGAIKKMEKNTGPLTEEDIRQMVEFLKDLTVSERITHQKEKIESKFRAELPPASFQEGQELFRGQKPLASGGPACFTCHRFANHGGNLGPDLTNLKDRSSGVVLQSAIENANYKIMRSIYSKHKISKEEALHLAEFLTHPENVEVIFTPTMGDVGRWALGGVSACLMLMWVFNKKKKEPTRKNLIQKHLKG